RSSWLFSTTPRGTVDLSSPCYHSVLVDTGVLGAPYPNLAEFNLVGNAGKNGQSDGFHRGDCPLLPSEAAPKRRPTTGGCSFRSAPRSIKLPIVGCDGIAAPSRSPTTQRCWHLRSAWAGPRSWTSVSTMTLLRVLLLRTFS